MQRPNGSGLPRDFQQFFDQRKGLPRTTFADDPFFDQHTFPHRRFGSNPRLHHDFFGDEPSFPQPSYFQQPSFSQSLPRHPRRQQSQSESQPSNVTIIKTNIPEENPPQNTSQSAPQGTPQKPQQTPPQTQSIPVQHIKTERSPVAKSPSADSQSTSSSSGIVAGSDVPNSRRESIAESEKPVEMPAPATSSGDVPVRQVPIGLMRNRSVDDFNEQIVNLLDEAERRVEMLREQAGVLEQEKEQLLDMLKNVSLNTDLLRLGQGDREDINATTDRLLKRCTAVEVVVNTPRNEEQTKALNAVNSLIEGAVTKMQEDLLHSRETVQRFLNACNPDMPEGPIDQRFQAQVIECTADDQKKIRRKLANIIQQIERAQRTCQPSF
uniref:BAG domain-containing protein n=1 Tax=Steinernema glaseri TaxID=37863 RepID=A0A1I8AGL0_9BILA